MPDQRPLGLNTALFAPDDRVGVAVSGGADSLALLHALTHAGLPIAVEVVHVHHGMRGEEADADAAFLEALCARWEVPLVVVRRDVPALARERRISLEEAGRQARYAAFEELASEHGWDKIATAHTADDQAETVLLHLLRGTGVDGLAGIPDRRPLQRGSPRPEVVRPLLGVWRVRTESYCRENGLSPRLDRTNLDRRYARARVRHEALPFLEARASDVREHLVRLARQAADERDLLRAQADALLASARVPLAEPFALNAAVLARARPALARRALREALLIASEGRIEIGAALLDRMLELVSHEGSAAFDLPGCGLRARRRVDLLLFEPQARAVPAVPAPVLLAIPGRTSAPGFGMEIEVTETTPPADPRLPPDQALLDPAAVRSALRVRAPRSGDRFHPLGAPGSRLLSDLFIDRKVPRERRAAWPLVEDDEGIVWVVGLAVAERVRITPRTELCWRLTALPLVPDD